MMEVYIRRRKNTAAQYIDIRSLMDLCETIERMQGARVGILWMEQSSINMEGARYTATVAVEVNEDGLEDYRRR